MAKDSRKGTTDGTLSLKEKQVQGTFKTSMLSKADQALYKFVQERIPMLQTPRKNHYGLDLDQLWNDADRDYIPHRLNSTGRKAIATDESKGWRSQKVQLGDQNWQSDLSQSNPYVKIQTALSIMIDQNPSGSFTATTRKYEATTELIKQLYQRSWDFAKSKSQLKLFVFNLAKYGWAAARTYPLRIVRNVRVLKEYNPDDPSKSVYEEKEVVEYDDIMRENLDTRNVWMDDMAKPNNSMSVRDWCFRKVYDYDAASEEFGKYPNWKYVQKGSGTLTETIGNANNNASSAGANSIVQNVSDTKNLVEFFFYENLQKDCLVIMAGNVPICIDPLPISNTKGLKKLSLWQTYWTLRHSQSPYGIGIYEAIRYDQAFLDRIRNMTVDQVVMSIYKMWFYQGTNSLTDTGDIKIQPGVGKQVLDPKNITWLEVPGPGKDAYLGIDMFSKDLDDASGISPSLEGEITGKTAFEIAQAKESALKRLKNPLDNILDALNDEGYITISLMQMLYSIPETYAIGDPNLIADYLKETEADPELFERTTTIDDNGEQKDTFTAKVYREFPLNLSEDEKGNMTQTKDTQFFRIKPDALDWEGIINIKSQSLLSTSKQVEKALDLEMYNLLIPLLQGIAQERMLKIQSGQPATLENLTNGKTAKEIIKLYDKDPKDILPDEWFVDQQAAPSLFVGADNPGQPASGQSGPQGQAPQQQGGAQTLVPQTTAPSNPQSFVGKISSGLKGTV